MFSSSAASTCSLLSMGSVLVLPRPRLDMIVFSVAARLMVRASSGHFTMTFLAPAGDGMATSTSLAGIEHVEAPESWVRGSARAGPSVEKAMFIKTLLDKTMLVHDMLEA